MGEARNYDNEFKAQAVKLARETICKQTAAELGVPYNTLSGWLRKAKNGEIDPGAGEQTPETALTLAAEVQLLRKQIKERDKEIKRLNELNDFLEEASAFFEVMLSFPASRWKSGKGND